MLPRLKPSLATASASWLQSSRQLAAALLNSVMPTTRKLATGVLAACVFGAAGCGVTPFSNGASFEPLRFGEDGPSLNGGGAPEQRLLPGLTALLSARRGLPVRRFPGAQLDLVSAAQEQETLRVGGLPAGRTVLQIGDSFAGALGLELNQELAHRNVRGIVKYETATYIPTWASGPRLDAYLSAYKPDLVLITLGGNDLEVADPQSRSRSIRRLVSRLHGRPCVWVGIPLWDKAPRALLHVIEQHSAPCLFLDSNELVPDLGRARDGIHPSMVARQRWARAVVEWLEQRTDATVQDHWAWLPGVQPGAAEPRTRTELSQHPTGHSGAL